ncbi:hypothetical protein L7F22_000637 [Adiantum nelumboides]|nr:hypothetical protein [Adiantum nelumboides]
MSNMKPPPTLKERNKSPDDSMEEDVAPQRRRAQRSPTPTKRKRSPRSPPHHESTREEKNSKKKKEKRGHPLLHLHHLLPLWMKVVAIFQRNHQGEDIEDLMLLGEGPQSARIMSRNLSCTIYVGNLPGDVREEEIEDLFRKYGRIVDIDLKLPPRSPAFCFLQFEEARDAEDAVKGRDGVKYAGSTIRRPDSRTREPVQRTGIRDIMPRRPNPLWAEHTNVLRVVNTSRQAGSGTRTWVCKYCGEQMTSTITRVLKHLIGIGTTGHCGGYEAVPPALRDALILEHFPPGSTASSQSGGARAAATGTEDALQDALLGDIGGSASALPSFAGTSRKRARVSQAEDEGASASTASTGIPCTLYKLQAGGLTSQSIWTQSLRVGTYPHPCT